MEVKSRREAYSEATRNALVAAARRLFTRAGYAGTSIEDIARAARVTRGAFYHHFESKQAVFEEVFADVHTDLVRAIAARMTGLTDIWEASVAGLEAYLDACLDRDYQAIAIREAPMALGWERYRALDERHAYGLVRDSVEGMMAAGIVEEASVDVCARILFAAFAEAGIMIAAADDQAEAKDSARRLLLRFMDGVRIDRGRPAGP